MSDLTNQPPSRVRFGVLAFVCSLSLLTYLDRICIMQVQESVQRDLTLSDTAWGLVLSAFLLGYALFEVPGGWMGDAWGARRVIVRIVVWWSLFTALTGSVPAARPDGQGLWGLDLLNGFVLLLVVRFLFGCGEAGVYPNLSRVTGAWFPFHQRALVQGSIWTSARLGGAIAPLVIGRLSASVGWRAAFWVLGLIGAVWALLFYRWFRDTPEETQECNDAERALIRAGPYSWKSTQAAAGHASPPWRRIALSRNIWALCLASAGVSFSWYFFSTWQPQFLKDRFRISFEDSEVRTGLPFLFGAAGCLVGGRLSDWLVRRTGSRRWGRSLLGLTGFGGAGCCVLAAGWVPEAWQATSLFCLASFFNDLPIPVIWAVCTDIGGRYAGTVSGVMNMGGGIGSVISPTLTAVLRSFKFDWSTIFAILAASWFIAALAWLRINAAEPIVPEEEQHSEATNPPPET